MAETKKYYHNLDVDNNKVVNLLLNPLTTTQRTAVGITLDATDQGYVCYDTTLNKPYFWDGTQWVEAGGGVSGSGTATRLAFWSGTTSLTSSANLYWDNVNSRLGIGTSSPAYILDVAGQTRITYNTINSPTLYLTGTRDGYSYTAFENTSSHVYAGVALRFFNSLGGPSSGDDKIIAQIAATCPTHGWGGNRFIIEAINTGLGGTPSSLELGSKYANIDINTVGNGAGYTKLRVFNNGTVSIGSNPSDDGNVNNKLQVSGYVLSTGYKIPSGTATQFLMANGSVTTGNGGVYTYEIHVSQIDGNNTTGTGSVLNPVASITKALTLVDSQRKTIIVHPGTYTESPNITVQYTVLTSLQNIGGNTLISGTVSTNTGCTISGLKMTNLTVTGVAGTGNINILNCDISGTLSKSGTADYVLIRFCDIGNPQAGTGGLNVTSSAGLTAVFGGNPNFINVNNAGARVLVKNATTAASVLLAGSLIFADSIILALATQWVTGTTYAVGSLAYNLGFTYVRIVAGAGSTAPASDPTNWFLQSSLNGIDTRNAITTAIGSIITIANSQIIVPTFQNVARVYFGGIYSELNTVYDRPNSTLSAYATSGGFQVSGSTNSIIYSQFMNADKFIKQGGTSSQYLMADGSTTTGGGISRNISSVSTATAAGSATQTDYIYLVSGTTTVTLPSAVSNTNLYTIKRVGTNTVSIATTSSQTIDDSASPITINLQYVSLTLISDGANWNII